MCVVPLLMCVIYQMHVLMNPPVLIQVTRMSRITNISIVMSGIHTHSHARVLLVAGLVFNMLEERYPNPKEMQINLTGFLERNTRKFMPRLWDMLLSACSNPTGTITMDSMCYAACVLCCV